MVSSTGSTCIGKKLWMLFGFGGLILIIDLASKALISRWISLGHSIDIVDNILRITYIHNRGAIFGLSVGDGTGSIVLVVSLLAALFITVYYLYHPFKLKWQSLGLILILSGAVGNLYDRITLGEVRDFIDVGLAGFRWPIFNVADLAVTLGAVFLALELTRKDKGQELHQVSGE